MKKNGFTLVELLVTVAVLAIMMAIVTGILINVNKVSAKTTAEARLDSSMSRTLEIIKRSIRQAQISLDPNIVQPVATTNSLSVNVFTAANTTENITFTYDSTHKTIYVGANDADIIGENIVSCVFEVVDARRYGNTPPALTPENPGVPIAGQLYFGGNTLVKITLEAEIKVPGETSSIRRTVSDTIITKVGVGQ